MERRGAVMTIAVSDTKNLDADKTTRMLARVLSTPRRELSGLFIGVWDV
jgi:hypothetical protein